MQYSPTVNDQSGQIMASGQIGAAQTNAQMMGQFGQDIGSAIKSIGGTIAGGMQANAQADSAFDAITAIGQMYPGMKKISTALGGLDQRTRRLASMSILDNLGAISQLGIAGMNSQARNAALGMTAAAPGVKLYNDNQKTISEEGPGYSGATRRLY